MKKNYISPIIEIDDIEAEEILAGTIDYTGTAGEEHGGGDDGKEDQRVNPPIGGTGGSSDFELGSKNDSFSWD